jgi:hypothetical protein
MSRAEISDPRPGTNMNVLTVLYATSSGGAMPATSAIATDANHMGVLVADQSPKVVVFGVGAVGTSSYPDYAAAQYDTVTYSANYSGTARHIVANLVPYRGWTVKRGAVQIASGVADASGTAYFTDSTGGTFSISQAFVVPSAGTVSGVSSRSGAIAH